MLLEEEKTVRLKQDNKADPTSTKRVTKSQELMQETSEIYRDQKRQEYLLDAFVKLGARYRL